MSHAPSDNLSPSEIEAAHKIHHRVIEYLNTRYFFAVLVFTVLAPVIGLIGGALIESKLFSSSRERVLNEAKADIEKEVQKATDEIRATSLTARTYLDEIRSTRQALDYVLHGTQTGDLAFLQKRSTEVEKIVGDFKSKLTKWENDLKTDIPGGLKGLTASAEEVMRLRDAVEKLEKLFSTNDTARALAGAFYRIDELLGDLELCLYVPHHMSDAELDSIIQSAQQMKANVKFSRSVDGSVSDKHSLEWTALAPAVSREDLKAAPSRIGNAGEPRKVGLKFAWQLPNQASWWHIAEQGASTIKGVDLETCSTFDTVQIAIEIPISAETAYTHLSKCTFSEPAKGQGPCPAYLRFKGNVNRVEILLEHVNGGKDVAERPFYGEMRPEPGSPAKPEVAATGTEAAKPAVAEKAGRLSMHFANTKMFHGAATKYVNKLGSHTAPVGVNDGLSSRGT